MQAGQLQTIMQTVGTVGKLLENYDSMMLGVKLSRVGEAPVANTNAAAATNSSAATSNTATDNTETNAENTGNKVLNGLGNLFKKK